MVYNFRTQLAEALLTRLHGRLHVAEPSDVAAMVWALPHITYPYTEVFVHGHRRYDKQLEWWRGNYE